MAGQRCLQRETLSSLVVLTTVELCLTREGTLAVAPVRVPALGQAGQDRQLWATKGNVGINFSLAVLLPAVPGLSRSWGRAHMEKVHALGPSHCARK